MIVMKIRNIITIGVFATIFVLSSFSKVGVLDNSVNKIIIDAGHGGKDPGTHGKYTKEKDIALKIAKKAGKYIEEYMDGVEVIFTRDDDTFIPLEGRAQIANKNGADLFISIHCNSFPRPDIYGTETYIMGLHVSDENLEVAKRENSAILLEEDYEETYGDFDPNSPDSHILFSLYQSAYLQNSLNLATKIETQFSKRAGRKSRGVKQAGFWVLYRTSMPSVLVETGYLSNPNEEVDLNDALKQDYLASGIFRAVRAYKEEIDAMK